MKIANLGLLIIIFLNMKSEDFTGDQNFIKHCNDLLSNEEFICNDFQDLLQNDLWQNYSCTNHLKQNKLQQPEELKDILERLSPQEFDQKTERSTTFEIGCALKRYLQYLDEHQKNLDQLKTEENKKRIDLVLSGNLDDEVLTAKMDLNIDICNEILFKDVYSAEKDSECDFSDVIQSQDWKNNQCTMWLKQGKLNSQLDVATYKFGTTLYCFEKRQKEILKLLNQ